MNLTNKTGLPDAIFQAVKNDPYTKGDADASVNEIVGPPRKAALTRRHQDEITEDCADRIYSLLGQSIHTILERANKTGVAERRLSIMVEGWKISGGMDLYDEDGTLVDYKTTTVYQVRDGIKDEWLAQLNVYAEILRQNGHPVKGLKVVAIIRDWSKSKMREEQKRGNNYPEQQVAVMAVEMWPEEQARKYIRERVILHQQARVELPLCTTEERWVRDEAWAVKKSATATRAVNGGVHSSEASARNHAEQIGGIVEHRPGTQTRCELYCSVAPFCSQFKALSSSERSEWENEPLVLGQGKAG